MKGKNIAKEKVRMKNIHI